MNKQNIVFFFLSVFFLSAVTAQELESSTGFEEEITNATQLFRSNPDSALYHLRQAKFLIQHDTNEVLFLKRYGNYKETQSQYDSAIYYYQASGDLAEQINLPESIADAIHAEGRALVFKGDLAKGQENLLTAITYYKENSLVEKQANAYSNLGIALHKSGDIDGAKEMYKNALRTSEKVHYNSLSHLAIAYENQGQLDSALTIYDSLSVIHGRTGNLRALFNTYQNVGIVYEKRGELGETLRYYKQASGIAKQLGYQSGLAIAYQNLVRASYMSGDFPGSQRYLDSAYVVALEAQNLEVFIKLKGDEAYIAEERGDFRRAVKLYEESITLRDSLQQQNQAALVQELSVKYETAANKERIALLQLDQQKGELALAKSQSQRNLFVAGSAILLAIALLFFYRYQLKQKASKVLAEKNKQISDALAEREVLLKEIHHRVKNNLQIISSLLYLQEGTLEDEKAKDAIRQGQHRVQAMSLIHQRLYTADDVRGVDIQQYFEKLGDELFTAFGVDEEKIGYEVQTNGLKLDIDTVIPLGLIINELLTNAIKYAFEGKEEGHLAIELSEKEEMLEVTVKDDGIGMNEDSVKNSNAFGWTMMHSLARKLKAEINISNQAGTKVQMTISRYQLV